MIARRKVVVVGGGVVGCAVAFRLAADGWAVTLIERDSIAAHASGRNAGNLNPLHGSPPGLIPFAIECHQRQRQIFRELSRLDCAGYRVIPVRRLHLGVEASERSALEETAALFNRTPTFSASWLDRDALRRLEPRLSPDLAFGVLTEGAASVDSADFTRSLAAGAVKLGAVVARATATGISRLGDRIEGVRTDAGTFPCDAAVFATGPWVAQTREWLDVDLAVQPLKGELLTMRLPDGPLQCDLTLGQTALYRRREDEVWLGTTMAEAGFDETPTPEAKSSLLAGAARVLPEIPRARLIDHFAALRPMPRPNAPIYRRADYWRNAYLANGGGGKGVLLSVGIAQRICELMRDTDAAPSEAI